MSDADLLAGFRDATFFGASSRGGWGSGDGYEGGGRGNVGARRSNVWSGADLTDLLRSSGEEVAGQGQGQG